MYVQLKHGYSYGVTVYNFASCYVWVAESLSVYVAIGGNSLNLQ